LRIHGDTAEIERCAKGRNEFRSIENEEVEELRCNLGPLNGDVLVPIDTVVLVDNTKDVHQTMKNFTRDIRTAEVDEEEVERKLAKACNHAG